MEIPWQHDHILHASRVGGQGVEQENPRHVEPAVAAEAAAHLLFLLLFSPRLKQHGLSLFQHLEDRLSKHYCKIKVEVISLSGLVWRYRQINDLAVVSWEINCGNLSKESQDRIF